MTPFELLHTPSALGAFFFTKKYDRSYKANPTRRSAKANRSCARGNALGEPAGTGPHAISVRKTGGLMSARADDLPRRIEAMVSECSARSVKALVVLAMTLLPWTASADEGGVPFWWSGANASLAAVPEVPGWGLALLPYYYNGSADSSKSFHRGGAIVAGLAAQSPLLFAWLGYASETKILGGQPYVGLGWGVARNSTQADVSVSLSDLAPTRNRSDSIVGGMDLYPIVRLAWTQGDDNWMTYLTGDIPTGAYNSQRLSNVGLGHGAIDAGGGYTYLNNTNGREFSAVVGFTYSWENTDTNYKNGVDSHLDWAASQFLSANWEIGVVGYVYYQLSADSYPTSGAAGALRSHALGSFKSRVAAAGPEVGYVFKVAGQPAYLNLRAYWEFWAQNRVEGYALFATVSIPLSSH